MDVSIRNRYYTNEHFPFFWTFFVWFAMDALLESVPMNPTKQDQDEIYSWVYLTLRRLPCHVCRQHAVDLFNENPIDLRTQNTAQIWWCQFHNKVNEKLGKPQLSFEEVQQVRMLTRRIYWPNVWKDLQDNRLLECKETTHHVKPVSFFNSPYMILIVVLFVCLVMCFIGMLYYRQQYWKSLKLMHS